MEIFANLNALERQLDLLSQEERTITVLIQILQEQQDLVDETTPELRMFLVKELCFLQDERKTIQLRFRLMEKTLNDLRNANNALKASLQGAYNELTTDLG